MAWYMVVLSCQSNSQWWCLCNVTACDVIVLYQYSIEDDYTTVYNLTSILVCVSAVFSGGYIYYSALVFVSADISD